MSTGPGSAFLAVYNGEKYSTRRFVRSSRRRFRLRAYISDNASTDGPPTSALRTLRKIRRIRYSRNDRNIGGANNGEPHIPTGERRVFSVGR